MEDDFPSIGKWYHFPQGTKMIKGYVGELPEGKFFFIRQLSLANFKCTTNIDSHEEFAAEQGSQLILSKISKSQ